MSELLLTSLINVSDAFIKNKLLLSFSVRVNVFMYRPKKCQNFYIFRVSSSFSSLSFELRSVSEEYEYKFVKIMPRSTRRNRSGPSEVDDAPSVPVGDYAPDTYNGPRDGWTFREGSSGVGYYRQILSTDDFHPNTYEGPREGWSFREGTLGVGYYKDAASEMNGAPTDAPGPVQPRAQQSPAPMTVEQFLELESLAAKAREGNYELHSLFPNYKQVTFHKCVVARIKRGLLQSEQESEKNRRARKRLIKAVDNDEADNFILSGETAAPIETKLTRASFQELEDSNDDSDYISFETLNLMATRPILEFADIPLRERKSVVLATAMIPNQPTMVQYDFSSLKAQGKKHAAQACRNANRMTGQHLGMVVRVLLDLCGSLVFQNGPKDLLSQRGLAALDITLNAMREIHTAAAKEAGLKEAVSSALSMHERAGETPLVSNYTRSLVSQNTTASDLFVSNSGNRGRGGKWKGRGRGNGGNRGRGARGARWRGRGRGGRGRGQNQHHNYNNDDKDNNQPFNQSTPQQPQNAGHRGRGGSYNARGRGGRGRGR